MKSPSIVFFASALPSLVATVLVCGHAIAADPSTGDCLTASDASLKFGNEHKLRAERAELLICAARSCPTDIRKECLRRVDEVNAAIPTIVFDVKDAQGNDLSAVKVIMDQEVLAERLDGTAFSIDPGVHDFVFETRGQPAFTKELMIRESEKERRESISFAAAAPPPAVVPPPQMPAVAPLPPPVAAESTSTLGSQRALALVAAGVGVIGIGVGTGFGLSASSKKHDAEKVCPHECVDDAGVQAWKDARTAGNVSTVSFIVGGVGVAAAAVLWFTAPHSAVGTQVGFGSSGVHVRGIW